MTFSILFICTHNRCRSVLSEAITNHIAGGKITAYSAGSQPAGVVHPDTLKHLDAMGIDTSNLKSQSWEDFAELGPDLVVTVCDSAANEACPIWMGGSRKLHWGLTDPSKMEGSEEEVSTAFKDVIATIERRIKALLALDLSDLDSDDAKTALAAIAEIQ